MTCSLCRRMEKLRTGDDGWVLCQFCLIELVNEATERDAGRDDTRLNTPEAASGASAGGFGERTGPACVHGPLTCLPCWLEARTRP